MGEGDLNRGILLYNQTVNGSKPDEMLLAIVGSKDGYALPWVAQHAHVHEHGHHILCLGQVLRGSITWNVKMKNERKV